MKNLKRFSAVVVLTCLLGLSALAGETSSPPCVPPVPGETSSPPCTGQVASDGSGAATVQPVPVQGTEVTYLVAQTAINLIESLLLY